MNKDLHYLPFQSSQSPNTRLYGPQRRELETRANFIRRVQQNPDTYIDPVLRFHLGLDPVKPPTSKS